MSEMRRRLADLGLTLPPAHRPVGPYVGAVKAGGLVWISGVGPTWGQEVRFRGQVGRDLTLDEARQAARLTGLNLLAQLDLLLENEPQRVARCVKLFGLVNAGPDFEDAH